MKILRDIPFSLDAGSLAEYLRIEPGSKDEDEILALVDLAKKVSQPKAGYKVAYVERKNGETVQVDDVIFTSRVLRKNLDSVGRVFPFVATCGREAEEAYSASGDMVKGFWWERIKEELLNAALNHLSDHLHDVYRLQKSSSMSPGGGDVSVWPIEEQKLLFQLLGNTEQKLGVRLTESCLMIPNKTVSGIRFPTEKDFRSCQVCRRKGCPSRKMPFDKDLWDNLHSQ